jgi:hypothetical protein
MEQKQMPKCFVNVPPHVLVEEQSAFADMPSKALAAYRRILTSFLSGKGIVVCDDWDKLRRHHLMVADELLARAD